MRKGYLFSSKDGAFSFANEVPGVFENAKNAEGFVEITKLFTQNISQGIIVFYKSIPQMNTFQKYKNSI